MFMTWMCWKVEITLKNGECFYGYTKSKCDESNDVIKELMGENFNEGSFSAIFNTTRKGIIFVKTSEIVSVELTPDGAWD